MGRLIDADNLIQKLKRTSVFECVRNSADKNVFEIINEQPTAYNVENVVAEIRRCSGNGYRDVDGDYVPPMIRTKDVIEIVKGGDVDD